jgi:hypothetical protein
MPFLVGPTQARFVCQSLSSFVEQEADQNQAFFIEIDG